MNPKQSLRSLQPSHRPIIYSPPSPSHPSFTHPHHLLTRITESHCSHPSLAHTPRCSPPPFIYSPMAINVLPAITHPHQVLAHTHYRVPLLTPITYSHALLHQPSHRPHQPSLPPPIAPAPPTIPLTPPSIPPTDPPYHPTEPNHQRALVCTS
jgi:hypothetical protein